MSDNNSKNKNPLEYPVFSGDVEVHRTVGIELDQLQLEMKRMLESTKKRHATISEVLDAEQTAEYDGLNDMLITMEKNMQLAIDVVNDSCDIAVFYFGLLAN